MSPVKGMDFARNQLLKYGWKEGKGLGRNETGIQEALKPKLKFDNRGIGHDASEQFTYHWWENAFNNAANNIQVSTTEDGVAVELQDESMEITTKKYSLKALRKQNSLEYGTFLKTSTLTGNGEIVRIAQSKPEATEVKNPIAASESLTDDDLFRICGGRTAHKGARHGLKLNGKLARIEQQERQLLIGINEKKNKEDKPKQNTKCEEICETRKPVSETEKEMSFLESTLPQVEHYIKKKKKSKRHSVKNELMEENIIPVPEIQSELFSFEDDNTVGETFTKCKKKRRKSVPDNEDKIDSQDLNEINQDLLCNENVILKKKKKGKRKKYNDALCENIDSKMEQYFTLQSAEENDVFKKKKRKKHKNVL
ncbi:G patch domain-containing protein 4 [Periplaneta americana]|uniref:G patch domain-containing protein 4 n=1 Tax=Periplaneta americana TaxID=6978 RepID=UPI0037E9992D